MNGEENMDPVPENNDTSEDVNENSSQEATLEQSKTQSENMEVHAHDLHKAPGQGWKHYLFEFLMLFLAVFCGFLAKNFREHQVEEERGKQYIQSFYGDLHYNLATFSRIIDANKQKIDALNNLDACYDSLSKNWKNSSCLAALIKNSSFFWNVEFSNGTIDQLKNAGGFRLLKRDDRDSIISYDEKTRRYKDAELTMVQPSQDNVRNNTRKLVNFKANKFIDSANYVAEIPLLFSDNKDLLNEFFNDLLRYKRAINFQSNLLINLKEKTSRLIEYFNTKYHFD